MTFQKLLLLGIFLMICAPPVGADTSSSDGTGNAMSAPANQLTGETVSASQPSQKLNEEKAPSMDKVRWLEAKSSSDFNAEYDYAGSTLKEEYTDFRYLYSRRTLLAFLVQTGVEWQRTGFADRGSLLLPGQLEIFNLYLGINFRWSKKDLFVIQTRPGFFGDFEGNDTNEFNYPIDVAYTRVPSMRLQWAVGLSINTWRRYHVLPGGGLRYHVNDRWQLKFMLPTPQIEYKPTDVLTLVFGADFRGDSFRVAKNFGSIHGDTTFNSALVDYSEIRVGPGFSWNIKPLLEFNMQAGIIAQRQYDYHNNGLLISNGAGAPFVNIMFHWLIKMSPPQQIGPDIQSGRFQAPVFHNLLQFL